MFFDQGQLMLNVVHNNFGAEKPVKEYNYDEDKALEAQLKAEADAKAAKAKAKA